MLAMSEAAIPNKVSTSGRHGHDSISLRPLLFAASNRNPSAPSDSKSFACSASLERTFSDPVFKLSSDASEDVKPTQRKKKLDDAYSARLSN